MIAMGPWKFTEQDARRTIDVLPEIIDHAAWQRPPAFGAELRNELAQVPRNRGELSKQLEDAWTLMTAIRPSLTRHRLLPDRSAGRLGGIFTSDGGVPKHPTATATVDFTGVVGDRQATRVHHGRPWQALCLWSLHVIDELVAHGHAVYPGAAGENLSVQGLDWRSVQPGVRLQVGEMLCEVSAYAIPCRKNAQWFMNGRFNTMHHEQGPVSRVYATVLEPGRVSAGDVVTLEP